MRLRCIKMAKEIEVLLGTETFGNPRHSALDDGLSPSGRGEERRFNAAFAILLS